MKISVKVKPGSKAESVEAHPDGSYIVRVKAPAREGRANEALADALGRHFGVPKGRVRILHGGTGRLKLIEIL
jgi:uncharacterized protein (TIGR00251 family)